MTVLAPYTYAPRGLLERAGSGIRTVVPLVLVVAPLLLGAAAALAETDPDDEIRLGYYMDRQVVRTELVVMDARVNQNIERVGWEVARHCHRPALDYHFRILNNPTVNAFATSGGFIYVTSGLLEVMESPAELAGILAHEVHHAASSSVINRIRSQNRKSKILPWVGLIGGSIVGGIAGDNLADALNQAPGSSFGNYQRLVNLGSDIGASAGALGAGVLAIAMQKGYAADQEFEADSKAVEYMMAAGYDPDALVDVMEKFLGLRGAFAIEYGHQAEYKSALINKKPGLEKRIARLREWVGKRQREE